MSSIRGRLVTLGLLLAAAVAAVPPETAAEEVTESVIALGSVWRYEDTGTDWRAKDHDDTGWASGAAELGYGDGDEATVISYGTRRSDKHRTAYFRRDFNIEDPAAITAVDIGIRRDDGAVVYLNGTEVGRTNLPEGPILFSTYALTHKISETALVPMTADPGLLVAGTNTLAVEVHQAGRSSSDLSFDLQLHTTRTTTVPTSTTTTVPTTTTTVPQGSPQLLVTGDIARCNGSHGVVADLLDARPDGWFLPAGDIAYPDGSAADFANCYDPRFGPHRDRTRPVPGNHEYYSRDAQPYFDYFGDAAGERGKGWYSWDVDGWHVVAVNSNCGYPGIGCSPGTEQYEWLAADLAAARQSTECVAMYWHHAPTSSEYGYVGSGLIPPIWQLAVANGVDMVFSGHAHVYERFARLGSDLQPAADGTRVFVVGTGGHDLRAFGSPVPGSEKRINSDFGLLEVSLHAGGYSWNWVPEAGGDSSDSGPDGC